jgi:hypothetical protein
LVELGLPSVDALILAVALERKRGTKSRFQPYLSTLPEAEPLPMMWSEEERKMLAGTGLDIAIRLTISSDTLSVTYSFRVALGVSGECSQG